ncbi:MAG TPA: DEAD/DEAH box helicase, partial [Arenimonas sp.]|uniref:DEAD/DEAH box helicase n=1 Tax=Arenimonas sp. TaxID=1872635 RepID=UPI002B7BA21B
MTEFSSLRLQPALLQGVADLGYAAMTPIQAGSLPPILEGRDVIAQARTGSGKTAAFGLGLLSRLDPAIARVQALVLCPTRELADQVTTEIRRLARADDNIKVVTLCGGVPLRGQLATLENGAHIVVGTPGRLRDHLERGNLQIGGLKAAVLDEADEMLDLGFREEIEEILDATPEDRRTL